MHDHLLEESRDSDPSYIGCLSIKRPPRPANVHRLLAGTVVSGWLSRAVEQDPGGRAPQWRRQQARGRGRAAGSTSIFPFGLEYQHCLIIREVSCHAALRPSYRVRSTGHHARIASALPPSRCPGGDLCRVPSTHSC